MKDATQDISTIIHNKVPNRIRFRVPLIKHKQTFAGLLKQSLLSNEDTKGIYHAEPNILTGTILVKFHPAYHSEEEMVRLVMATANELRDGKIEITRKHKNSRLGKMPQWAFFIRELRVSIAGNFIAGIFPAIIVTG